MQIAQRTICLTPSGEKVQGFTLENAKGSSVELCNLGARWISATVPDRFGLMENVLVSPADVLSDTFYMGAVVGRVANRIKGASVKVGGVKHSLDKNDGGNTNHGGFSGFDRMLWDWKILDDGVLFSRVSPHGEGGFPGNLHVEAEYRWSDDNELSLTFRASTDAATFVNLTNHAYFNLAADGGRIYHHRMKIPSTKILDTDSRFIPSGRLSDVRSTIFDFLEPKPLGADIHTDCDQMRWNRGYNHCYVLKEQNDDVMIEAAKVVESDSGRSLTVLTDQTSVLLYTAGYYEPPHAAFCLETQNWPDAPSHPDFPSALLRPGESYTKKTIYRFGLES